MTEHPTWSDPALPPGEPIPGQTYRADGWAYIDFPRMAPLLWFEIYHLLGPEHHVVLASTEAWQNDGRQTWRGQLLISPLGMERVAAWVKTKQRSVFN